MDRFLADERLAGNFYFASSSVWDVLASDLNGADLVLWVGMSFEQSASVGYFRRVLSLTSANTTMVVINPTEEAVWNLRTALSNPPSPDKLTTVLATSDDILPLLLTRSTATNFTPPPPSPTHHRRRIIRRKISPSQSSSSASSQA